MIALALIAALETLTIVGNDGSVAAIPFPSHERCLEAICLLSEHKTCQQVTVMQEALFERRSKDWRIESQYWNAWRQKHPCVDHLSSWALGSNVGRTVDGKSCPIPVVGVDGNSWFPPSLAPKHDDIVKFPTIPDVSSVECLK